MYQENRKRYKHSRCKFYPTKNLYNAFANQHFGLHSWYNWYFWIFFFFSALWNKNIVICSIILPDVNFMNEWPFSFILYVLFSGLLCNPSQIQHIHILSHLNLVQHKYLITYLIVIIREFIYLLLNFNHRVHCEISFCMSATFTNSSINFSSDPLYILKSRCVTIFHFSYAYAMYSDWCYSLILRLLQVVRQQ